MSRIVTDFIPDVDMAEYKLGTLTPDPALSQSIGKLLLRSPAHARAAHPRFGGKPRAPSDEMTLGNIFDELILGGSKNIFEVKGYNDFKTNAAKEIRDAAKAAGKIPLVSAKLDALKQSAELILKELNYAGIKLDGCAQACLLWGETASNGNEVQCCALLDMLWPDIGYSLDVKTGTDMQPDSVGAKAVRLGWDIQHAAYTSAIEHVFPALTGRAQLRHLLMETQYPHVPYTAELDGELMQMGRIKWARCVDQWEALTSAENRGKPWQGYVPVGNVYRIPCPPWSSVEALLQEDDDAS